MRLALLAAVVVLSVPQAAAAMPGRGGVDNPGMRVRLVDEVERGLAAASARWGWKGWFRDSDDTTSWSSIWDTVHLLEAQIGLQAAAPSAAHRRALIDMARRMEGYRNPRLADGLGGFSTGYALGGVQGTMYYDDDAWIGLAFFGAWEQTHERRFLRDAVVAFRFVYRAGWDPVGGGVWWNSMKTVKCAESVNTAALLAMELYDTTHEASYLRAARRLVDWSNAHLLDRVSGLYLNHPVDGVPISDNQATMLAALTRLCRDRQGYCGCAAALRSATLRQFGDELAQPPQFDAMYLRYLVAVDALGRDRAVERVVLANAARIETNALDADGFYLRAWNGTLDAVAPGLVSTHGAALEALAWAAVVAGRS